MISMIFMSGTSDADGQLDRSVGQGLLGDLVALLAGLDPRLLDGVDLEEAIQVALVAPGAIVVVVADLPGRRVDDDGIGPVGQPDDEPRGLAAEELCGAERSAEAARGGDRRR